MFALAFINARDQINQQDEINDLNRDQDILCANVSLKIVILIFNGNIIYNLISAGLCGLNHSILIFMFQARAIGDLQLALTTGAQVQVAANNADNDNIAARFNLIENAINAIATPDCT